MGSPKPHKLYEGKQVTHDYQELRPLKWPNKLGASSILRGDYWLNGVFIYMIVSNFDYFVFNPMIVMEEKAMGPLFSC